MTIPYSGKLLWEKRFAKWWKKDSPEKTFKDCLLVPPKDGKSPNFEEKSFTNSHKTLKFAEVFFLERFPLYSQILAKGSCATEKKQNNTNKIDKQTSNSSHCLLLNYSFFGSWSSYSQLHIRDVYVSNTAGNAGLL